MTITPATHPAPVPFAERQEFEARLRKYAVPTAQRATPTDDVCSGARDIAADYPWADTRTTANALVDALGTGWGAIYLHWAHEQKRRPGRA
jgi:hypothetical protein